MPKSWRPSLRTMYDVCDFDRILRYAVHHHKGQRRKWQLPCAFYST